MSQRSRTLTETAEASMRYENNQYFEENNHRQTVFSTKSQLWCDDLEDLLQCPICMLCPAKVSMHQCVEGHLICEYCKPRLSRCPMCNREWSIYRNRLAENMCLKFEDIKSSLIDPEAKINELLIPDKFCVGTQTDNVAGDGATSVTAVDGAPEITAVVAAPEITAVVAAPEITAVVAAPEITAVVAAPEIIKPAPVDPKGTYPCCIGNCGIKTSFELLIQHMKHYHPFDYIEESLGRELLFEHTFIVEYEPMPRSRDRVFRIHDVGAFVVKLSTDVYGEVRGYVMMIHCGVAAKQFSYQLKLSHDTDLICPMYTDNVYSCRSPASIFEEQCLRVPYDDILRMTDGGRNSTLKCTVLLARKLDDTQTLRINETKKRRGPKNPKFVNGPLLIL